jgi:hypothetical protein
MAHSAKQALHQRLVGLVANPGSVLTLHYACGDITAGPSHLNPVTCLAVRECQSGQIRSFGFAQTAPKQATSAQLRAAELMFLNQFLSYLATKQGATVVHWNMNSSTYGFPHLEARHAALGGSPLSRQPLSAIVSNALELSRTFSELLGDNYVNGKPRLKALAERNELTMRDFVDGKNEVLALRRKDYALLERSTNRKVQLLSEFLNLAATSRLRTDRWEHNTVAWVANRPWTRWAVPGLRIALGTLH